MQCPKCRTHTLVDSVLAENLSVQRCPSCKGNWIPTQQYDSWRVQQPQETVAPSTLAKTLEVDFVQSPYDTKAALCPQCGRFLSRAKVSLNPAFYVERCQDCGIWCDHGEWEVLEKLGLSTTIEQLFSSEWQAKVQKAQYSQQEQVALIDKVGEELASQIFDLADTLENHPSGDFALAYLMRRVGDSVQIREKMRNLLPKQPPE